MKSQYVEDLEPGARIDTSFLVQSKERKIARNGSAYLDLTLRDSTGSVRAKLWDCDRSGLDFEQDDVVSVAGSLEMYQGAPQLTIRRITRLAIDRQDLIDYLPRSRHDPEQMFEQLLCRIQELPETPLRQLLLAIFTDPEITARYKLAPAAVVMHHAFLGGLLEHVMSLLDLADRVCDHYTWLDRSLIFAGLLLHDLGKVEEINFERGFRYTTRGQLLGHITIGIEMIQEKLRNLPDFPTPLRDKLLHLVLSHHGKTDFGSPKEPVFPEALVVHYLDDLDSKLQSMWEQYQVDKNRLGEWTSRNRALGRELLKMTPPEALSATASAADHTTDKAPLRHAEEKP
ncbi:MAG TPA: HD domain-containing protein [Terriglobia bacterium]|nr:HD domain-containing protein [Terriglobia bacterium]